MLKYGENVCNERCHNTLQKHLKILKRRVKRTL